MPVCTYRSRHTCTLTHAFPCTSTACRHTWTQEHTQNYVDIQKHAPSVKTYVHAHVHTGLWQMPINTWLDLRERRQPARPPHTLEICVSFSNATALRPQSDRQAFWACEPSWGMGCSEFPSLSEPGPLVSNCMAKRVMAVSESAIAERDLLDNLIQPSWSSDGETEALASHTIWSSPSAGKPWGVEKQRNLGLNSTSLPPLNTPPPHTHTSCVPLSKSSQFPTL